MQSRLWIGGVLLVLSLSMQAATAGPQEDVAAAGQKWATVFAENNPDTMLPLYAKDAVLWETLSPTVRSDPAALKAYALRSTDPHRQGAPRQQGERRAAGRQLQGATRPARPETASGRMRQRRSERGGEALRGVLVPTEN